MEPGLLHIYTGDGKGKTTASIGLCIRACGVGKRVLFAQFLKGRPSGEIEPLKKLGITVLRTDPVRKFLGAMNHEERLQCDTSCQELFLDITDSLRRGTFDLVVLDEVLDALGHKIIDEEAFVQALHARQSGTEVVLTGRSPSARLCDMADYLTEMTAKKHPFERGISARKGIEY